MKRNAIANEGATARSLVHTMAQWTFHSRWVLRLVNVAGHPYNQRRVHCLTLITPSPFHIQGPTIIISIRSRYWPAPEFHFI